MANQAHNFAKESSHNEDDDQPIFCKPKNLGAPPPSLLHTYTSIKGKPPSLSKRINPPNHNPAPLIPILWLCSTIIIIGLAPLEVVRTCLVLKCSLAIVCNYLKFFDLVEAVATYVYAWTKTRHRMGSTVYFMAFIAQCNQG